MSRHTKLWAAVGKDINGLATQEEVIEKTGMDFTVEKIKNTVSIPYTDDDGIPRLDVKDSKDSFSTYRTDTRQVLGGRLGKRYAVVQNSDAFKFFSAIVGEGEAAFDTAGVIKGGEKIFMTAKLPEHIKVKNGDVIEKYLLFTMAHDGSGAIQAALTPYRILCDNMLNMALNTSSSRVTVRHTLNAQEQLRLAHEVLGLENQLSLEIEQIFNRLVDVKVDDNIVRGYIEQVFTPEDKLKEILAGEDKQSTRMTNKINKTLEMYEVAQGQETARGTLWGAYNAITAYQQHEQNFKDEDKRFESNIFGSASNFAQKALVLANSMAATM
jgi:phage/plasmid-like protein (TIGR03299 family)